MKNPNVEDKKKPKDPDSEMDIDMEYSTKPTVMGGNERKVNPNEFQTPDIGGRWAGDLD